MPQPSTITSLSTPHCELCGSKCHPRFEKFGCEYWACGPCGFEFVWPRPASDELEGIYQQDGAVYWSDERMVRFAFSPTKSRRELRFVQRFVTSGCLLDLGCSTGSFVEAALASGFKARGIDIAASSVAVGLKRGLPLTAGDILTMELNERFDIVTMWATLEHLADPMRHLRRAAELLRPAGILFVSVPNHRGVSQVLLGRRNRYVCREHLNYFQARNLSSALQRAGLSPIGRTTYAFNPIMFVKDALRGLVSEVDCERMAADSELTLRAKASFIGSLQQSVEWFLNLLGAGDVIAMAARKTG